MTEPGMWTVIKITGIVSIVLLTLLFFVLLVSVTRPAILWGVNDFKLASSTGFGSCEKTADGSWDCRTGINPGTTYKVEVDWMGCWEATRTEPAESERLPDQRSGCIELGDVIRFD